MEHGLAACALEEKTRTELGSRFWSDYRRSIRMPGQWEDTDPWPVNYIGHPIHGAGAGIIWLDHSDKDMAASVFSSGYIASRARAAAFSAIYSVQFEIGPLSEASIGNVRHASGDRRVGRLRRDAGWRVRSHDRGRRAGSVLGAMDRITRQESCRTSYGPTGVRPLPILANSAGSRLPWYRPDRTLSWR